MRKLTLIQKTVTVLTGSEFEDSPDLSGFDDLSCWEFNESNSGEITARYIGPKDETPDETGYTWYSSEDYWGVTEMNPEKFQVVNDSWVERKSS